MDIQTLTILKDISWAGVMALIVLCLLKPLITYFIAKKNGINNQSLSDRLDSLEFNHLEDVNRRLDNLERGQKEIWDKLNAIDKQVAILTNKFNHK